MEKKTFDIKGMSCAACASKIDRRVRKVVGVNDVNVILLKNRMTVLCDENKVNDDDLIKAVNDAGYSASLSQAKNQKVKKADESEEKRQKLRLLSSLALTLVLVLLAVGPLFNLIIIDNVYIGGCVQALLALAVMILQRRYYISALKALKHLGSNMDTLVSLGSAVSFIYSLYLLMQVKADAYISLGQGSDLYFDTAAAILTFVAIGKYFEERTKVKTADAVTMLYDLAPKFVNVKRGEQFVEIPLEECRKDDILVIKSGDQIGVDGTVVSGEGFTDESSVTGESRLIKKLPGSKIISSSVLNTGYLEVRADAVGAETTLSKIISLVDEASSRKAPIARTADLIASVFVPAVISIALITFIVWFFILDATLRTALNYAVSVLVVSCPCALGLATPLAIVAGTGRAASAGILFKSPEIIEKLRQATVYVFDKTGTLTMGNMKVTACKFKEGVDEIFLKKATLALESKSHHPLAQAVVKSFQASCSDYESLAIKNVIMPEGRGIEGEIAGETLSIGNERFVKEKACTISDELKAFAQVHEDAGATALYLMYRGEVVAILCIADEIKTSSASAVASLQHMGIKTLMLTGDSDKVAADVAKKIGINEYKASLMPAQKAEIIKSLQDRGEKCVMVGDGVNDSVALATAYAGIGLAGSSDIAVSACGVVLLRGQLTDCVNAAIISRQTMKIIKQNLFWAFIYNIIFIPVAAGCFQALGWHLTPVAGAVMMSLSSICVGLNALRLTKVKLNSVRDIKGENMAHKVINIEGMMCKHCQASVTKALQAIEGVEAVDVSLENKNATISCSEGVTDDALRKAVTDAGYEVKGIHN